MSERILPGASYGQPAHVQAPWWAGFNDARNGYDYSNTYRTLTARYEYQIGFVTGSPKEIDFGC